MLQENELELPKKQWQGKIACQYIDKEMKLDKKQIKTTLNSFIYGHIISGNVRVKYDDRPITIEPHDMIIFAPLSHPQAIEISEDFKAIMLIVSCEFAYESHDTSNLLHTLILSLTKPKSPRIQLSEEEHELLLSSLKLFITHIQKPNEYTYDALQSLYGLYLADMMHVMTSKGMTHQGSLRSYKIFTDFNDLLLDNFREHHDITFYADRLGISPRYLSMITKEITNNTVATFINKKLMYEACWLLRTTDLSINEISQKLHFSDQASFSKFFKRINGNPPLHYRKN